MTEPPSPLDALRARDLQSRAGATRELARTGAPEHLGTLLAVALADRSVGVRIGAATAMADILLRARLAGGVGWGTVEAFVLELLKPIEPGVNVALLQVDAELGGPRSRQRLAAALRDRRLEVRVGARAALGRAALSMRSLTDPWAREMCLEVLSEPRANAEQRAELCRLAARAGWYEAQRFAEALSGERTHVRGQASGPGGTVEADSLHAEAASWAVRVMLSPPALAGVWVDRGGDVYGGDAVSAVATFGLLDGSSVVRADASGGVVRRALSARPRRLLVRVGAEDVPVLQIVDPEVAFGARTLWPAREVEIAAFVQRLVELAPEAFDALQEVLPGLPEVVRARGRRQR